MIEAEALRMLAALGQTIRLKVVIALAESGRDGLASGDIADLVGVPRNLMSSHLAVLGKAGLVETSRHGRGVNYALRNDAVVELGRFLASLTDARRGTT